MSSQFHYHLPEEKIAIYPLNDRSDSKVLIYKRGEIEDSIFRDIHKHIHENSLIVRNSSKVLKARMFLHRETGSRMEVFCLNFKQVKNGMAEAECLIKNVKKLKIGEVLSSIKEGSQKCTELKATFLGRIGDNSRVGFSWKNMELDFFDILEIFGTAPLPPYIKREAEEPDSERYQTIYASENGSVAAPTAGLHFSPLVEENLKKKHIDTAHVILHVGLGTFLPMKSENYQEHTMHSESFGLSLKTLELLFAKSEQTNICVGTTSLRTLESLYIAAHFADSETQLHNINIGQWDYKNIDAFMTRKEAWQKWIQLASQQKVELISGQTSLMITPDYKCRTSDLLITNFHQPDSTLLLIVASFTGSRWKEIYAHALENEYRFLSYGDACLLENKNFNT
jgi:S-adenosylmethionine:tRNA ribosyltransferase-isomerase